MTGIATCYLNPRTERETEAEMLQRVGLWDDPFHGWWIGVLGVHEAWGRDIPAVSL